MWDTRALFRRFCCQVASTDGLRFDDRLVLRVLINSAHPASKFPSDIFHVPHPHLSTKLLPFLQPPPSTPSPIATLFVNLCAPPLPALREPRINDPEKYNHDAKCETGVQCCRKRHCVFSPPGGGAAREQEIEGEGCEGPDRKVETGLWGG